METKGLSLEITELAIASWQKDSLLSYQPI